MAYNSGKYGSFGFKKNTTVMGVEGANLRYGKKQVDRPHSIDTVPQTQTKFGFGGPRRPTSLTTDANQNPESITGEIPQSSSMNKFGFRGTKTEKLRNHQNFNKRPVDDVIENVWVTNGDDILEEEPDTSGNVVLKPRMTNSLPNKKFVSALKGPRIKACNTSGALVNGIDRNNVSDNESNHSLSNGSIRDNVSEKGSLRSSRSVQSGLSRPLDHDRISITSSQSSGNIHTSTMTHPKNNEKNGLSSRMKLPSQFSQSRIKPCSETDIDIVSTPHGNIIEQNEGSPYEVQSGINNVDPDKETGDVYNKTKTELIGRVRTISVDSDKSFDASRRVFTPRKGPLANLKAPIASIDYIDSSSVSSINSDDLMLDVDVELEDDTFTRERNTRNSKVSRIDGADASIATADSGYDTLNNTFTISAEQLAKNNDLDKARNDSEKDKNNVGHLGNQSSVGIATNIDQVQSGSDSTVAIRDSAGTMEASSSRPSRLAIPKSRLQAPSRVPGHLPRQSSLPAPGFTNKLSTLQPPIPSSQSQPADISTQQRPSVGRPVVGPSSKASAPARQGSQGVQLRQNGGIHNKNNLELADKRNSFNMNLVMPKMDTASSQKPHIPVAKTVSAQSSRGKQKQQLKEQKQQQQKEQKQQQSFTRASPKQTQQQSGASKLMSKLRFSFSSKKSEKDKQNTNTQATKKLPSTAEKAIAEERKAHRPTISQPSAAVPPPHPSLPVTEEASPDPLLSISPLPSLESLKAKTDEPVITPMKHSNEQSSPTKPNNLTLDITFTPEEPHIHSPDTQCIKNPELTRVQHDSESGRHRRISGHSLSCGPEHRRSCSDDDYVIVDGVEHRNMLNELTICKTMLYKLKRALQEGQPCTPTEETVPTSPHENALREENAQLREMLEAYKQEIEQRDRMIELMHEQMLIVKGNNSHVTLAEASVQTDKASMSGAYIGKRILKPYSDDRQVQTMRYRSEISSSIQDRI
ncbi:unnamed protein product [Owenia fusiformis]|nr:unnamed protein product [Owenia fusiformis]